MVGGGVDVKIGTLGRVREEVGFFLGVRSRRDLWDIR